METVKTLGAALNALLANQEFVTVVLVPLILWGASRLRALINGNVSNLDLQRALLLLNSNVQREALRAAQLKVEPAKATGDWTPEYGEVVRAQVIQAVSDKLGKEGRKLIARTLGPKESLGVTTALKDVNVNGIIDDALQALIPHVKTVMLAAKPALVEPTAVNVPVAGVIGDTEPPAGKS